MNINWTMLLLIGIFLCVLYLVLYLKSFDKATKHNLKIVLDEIEKIKRKR